MSASPLASALRCADGRCGTLLDGEAEVCDECGGTNLASATDAPAVLVGLAADRPVVFALRAYGATTVGRTAGSIPPPDVDLARFPASDSVHRRHAELEQVDGTWRITHLGRNPLVVQRPAETLVIQPGSALVLRTGDWLQFGRVRLRLLVAPFSSFDL